MKSLLVYLCENWWSFVLFNLCICVNSHDQVVAHQLGLTEGVGVAKVYHVVATVTPHSDLKRNQLNTINNLKNRHLNS